MTEPHPDQTLPGDLPPDPLPPLLGPDVCSNPAHPPATVMEPGTFRIRFPAFTIEWGDEDLRDAYTGSYVFCSFACLAAWATGHAATHDGNVLVEGEPPKEVAHHGE